jgi:aminopeptidase N
VPSDMLQHQLASGSSARVRWSACEGLGKKPDPKNLSALSAALGNEREHWTVRVQAARALGKSRAPLALEALCQHSKLTHPKVRRALAAALGSFRNEQAAALLTKLARKDPSYLVESEAARALGKTRQKSALKPLLTMIDRSSWADVVRTGVIDGLSALRDEAALEPVLRRTHYGYAIRGRRAAIGALAELGEGKRIREHLESLLDDADPHLRIDVVSALVRFGDARCRPALRRALEHELDGRVLRRLREALRDLGEGPAEKKRMADEIEGLRGELLELKARLSKIEAKTSAPDKSKGKSSHKPASAPRARGKRRSKR